MGSRPCGTTRPTNGPLGRRSAPQLHRTCTFYMKSPLPSPEVLPAGGGWVVLGFTVARLLVPTSPPPACFKLLKVLKSGVCNLNTFNQKKCKEIRYLTQFETGCCPPLRAPRGDGPCLDVDQPHSGGGDAVTGAVFPARDSAGGVRRAPMACDWERQPGK